MPNEIIHKCYNLRDSELRVEVMMILFACCERGQLLERDPLCGPSFTSQDRKYFDNKIYSRFIEF